MNTQNSIAASVSSTLHLHPFGMQMPLRSYTGESYRFGFQGQEKESEISGTDGGHLVFTYRIHDARLGRFLSVDPLYASYPWNSTYAFAENRVIDGIDLEGREYLSYRSSMFLMSVGKSSLSNITVIQRSNIPKANKVDFKTSSETGAYLVYGNHAMPTTEGREPSELSFRQNISLGKKIPDFWGLNPSMSDLTTYPTAVRGNDFSKLGSADPNNNSITNAGTVVAFLEHFFGISDNLSNISIWEANYKVQNDRKNYYKATNVVDYFLSNKPEFSNLKHVNYRSALVNILLDGTLNLDYFNKSNSDVQNMKNAAKIIYEVAFEIMKENGIKIQKETVEDYENLSK